jgi:hypothetical protein
MYINVIYFFVTHESCVHTIFLAFGEKTPSLLFMLRKEKITPSMPWLLYNIVDDEDFLGM